MTSTEIKHDVFPGNTFKRRVKDPWMARAMVARVNEKHGYKADCDETFTFARN